MMETPFNEGPFKMKPLGYCDCDAPFYLIQGIIHYTCDKCKSGSPVGTCSICFEPVYLLKDQLHRTCSCGTADVGNITYTVSTVLDPRALTARIFSLMPWRKSEPSLDDSTSEMSYPEHSHSYGSQRDFNAIEPPSHEHVRKIYNAICLAMRIHQGNCKDCDMLAEQGLMCAEWLHMSDSRKFWSKRLPEDEACSA